MTREGDPGFRVALAGTDDSFVVAPGESVLDAARRAGYWLPFECGWGSCARCKATLVEGELEYLFAQAPAIDERDQRRKRFLLCQTTPLSDCVVKPLRIDDQPPAERPVVDLAATLVRIEEIGPDIREFTFTLAAANGEAVEADFRPGQYATLEIADGLRRCYSMSSLPGANEISFIVKRYEGRPGSTAMFALEPGAVLGMQLPYGDMWLRDLDRPAILIAGGTGISAILSMVRSIVGDPAWADRHVHVLYGAATRSELVCWEELEAITEAAHRQYLHGALVQADESWAGGEGLVTHTLTALLSSALSADHDLLGAEVYLAGPPPMVRAVQEVLNENGIQLDRIHVDSFG